jgi:hypothetical protein
LTTDGPAGLPPEQDFGDAVQRLRVERSPICAVWRLIVCPGARYEARAVKALVRAALVTAFKGFECLSFLIVCNPRHELFYERACGMKAIARSKESKGLTNAPAVLMRCDREHLPSHWLRRGAQVAKG